MDHCFSSAPAAESLLHFPNTTLLHINAVSGLSIPSESVLVEVQAGCDAKKQRNVFFERAQVQPGETKHANS